MRHFSSNIKFVICDSMPFTYNKKLTLSIAFVSNVSPDMTNIPATHSTAHGPCESARPGTGHTSPKATPPISAMGTKCRKKKAPVRATSLEPWASGTRGGLSGAAGVGGVAGAAGVKGSDRGADFVGGEGGRLRRLDSD